MHTRSVWLAVLVAVVTLAGCGPQVVRAPLNPYVTVDLKTRHVKRVAVMPVVIPKYLMGQGGETVSVDLSNQFMTELAARRVFDLVAGEKVTDVIVESYGSPRDWIYDGTISAAISVGRKLPVDGVIFGRVTRYVQANLDRTEFEVKFDLVELASLETIWSVSELLVGEGGTPGTGASVQSPTARTLGMKAMQGAADRVEQLYATGGPIKVTSTSPRKIWGYSLVSTGAVTTVAAGYYLTMAMQAYNQYGEADSAADLAQYRNDTEEYDRMWMILGPVGLGLVGTGTYLLLTDPGREFAGPAPRSSRYAVAPVLTPNGLGLTCAGRF